MGSVFYMKYQLKFWLSGYDLVYSCGRLRTFRMSFLPPFWGTKCIVYLATEALCSGGVLQSMARDNRYGERDSHSVHVTGLFLVASGRWDLRKDDLFHFQFCGPAKGHSCSDFCLISDKERYWGPRKGRFPFIVNIDTDRIQILSPFLWDWMATLLATRLCNSRFLAIDT
jgi:hypothetical protein